MDPHTQLAEHLAFLTEIGVDGVSTDPAWRTTAGGPPAGRPETAGSAPAEPDAVVQPAPAATVASVAAAPAAPFAPSSGLDVGAGDPAAALAAIRADLGDCTRCKLHGLGRRQIVFGVGNPQAELMFAGEAPGRDEDVQGIPFVGRAGQLLTKMIEAMGLTRDQVYIANVIKCRPPENRNPMPDEVMACEPFLFRQVEVIKPKVIVALGTFAAQTLLKTQDSISRLRGRVFQYGGARLIPTFHPAYLLRSPERKRDTWEDLKRAMEILRSS
jgi:DNA polymerase